MALIALPAAGQLTNYTRLHSFGDPARSGDSPAATVIEGIDGALYGVTTDAAVNRAGTVFKVSKSGVSYTVLHRFGATPDDGVDPAARLVEGNDGFLYGTTMGGGFGGLGTAFRLRKDGSSYAVIHQFGLGSPGSLGFAGGMTEGRDGNLYGTTALGPGTGNGVVYKMQKDGGGFTVLHEFSGAVSLGERYPNAVTEAGDGKLYGTTFAGNATNAGVLFTLNRDGSNYAVLHEFGVGPGDGASPVAGVIEGSDGALYGTTFQGRNLSLGVIFRVQRNGGGYGVLRNFTSYSSEGGGLKSRLMESADGWLYGVGEVGGSLAGGGTAFRLRKDGSGFAVVRAFGVAAGDGSQPAELMQGRDGVLYGVTRLGGATGAGTVFKFNTNSAGYAVLVNFHSTGGDAQSPTALVEGNDGILHGVCLAGGTNGAGALYKVNRSGAGYSVLKHFGTSPSDAREPLALLIDSSALHGLTRSGGPSGAGTLFRIRRDGSGFVLLRSFGSSAQDAAQPSALIRGADGRLYGTSTSGGAGGGTLFRVETNGANFVILLGFRSGGSEPSAPNFLLQGGDGRLYGITAGGGGSNRGTIFTVTTGGTGFAVLHHFTEFEAESRAALGLLEGSDGLFYGATTLGGTNNAGTVFKLDRNGNQFTILRHFNPISGEGGVLSGGLIEGPDGVLYGTATFPESMIFQVARDGSHFAVLRRFASGAGDGQRPAAALLRGRDGALYGSAASGGDLGAGMIFRFGHALSTKLSAGVVSLGVTGIPGRNYQLQRSGDLVSWKNILPFVAPEAAPVSHVDPIQPGGAAFYRVLVP